MSNINYKQVFSIKRTNEEKIKKLCPNIQCKSGIYCFYRTDELGIKHGYIGKASKNLISRMADHLIGYQHIDLSIKKYGLYDENKNPYGYKCGVICYCCPEECDEQEQYYIKKWANLGVQLKNTQSGGGKGRLNINDNKSSKGYNQGLHNGYIKAIKEVRNYFDKYLDFVIKGKTNKTKERKFEEFKRWVYEETSKDDC